MNEAIALPAAQDIDLEKVQRAFEVLAETVKGVIDQLVEVLAPIIKAVMKEVTRIWEAVARVVVPPKWWHLYKHAKKARTRKKYGKKIHEAIAAALAGGGS